jgi:hypothetical protein
MAKGEKKHEVDWKAALEREGRSIDREAREKDTSDPVAQAAVITDALKQRESNLYVRSAQLDAETCAALDAWQQAHGVRSGSAALRLLVQQALAADGTLDVEKRIKVAHSGALRAARVAVLDALDALLDAS